MKIILLKDVPRIGVKGAILDLAPAYAMNSFVNKSLARLATNNDEKLLREKEDKKKEIKEGEKDKYIKIFSELERESVAKPFVIKKKVDNKNHFYAKFSKQDVLNIVFEKAKVSISESQIVSDLQNINQVGDYDIDLNVNNKKYKILVKIVKE